MSFSKLELTFNALPVSVNSAYMTRFGYRVLSPKAREFKEAIKEATLQQVSAILPIVLDSDVALRVKIDISTATWMTLKGKIRKKDIASFEKLCTDSVFSALGIDDSTIFHLEMCKSLGPDKITYTIETIPLIS